LAEAHQKLAFGSLGKLAQHLIHSQSPYHEAGTDLVTIHANMGFLRFPAIHRGWEHLYT